MKFPKTLPMLIGFALVLLSLVFDLRWLRLSGQVLVVVGIILNRPNQPEPALTLLDLNAPAPTSPPPSPR